MKKKAIGVIGGMGPEASQHLYGLLIHHAQKIYGISEAKDFPEIYIASLPVPDAVENLMHREDAILLLQDRIKKMERLPIRMFCIACNTGHLFLEEMKRVTDTPFISLLKEVPDEIISANIQRVGLLATPVTIRTRLYEDELIKRNITVVVPEENDVEVLSKIVKDTIAGKNKKKNSEILDQVTTRLIERGAQGIILGCTELPLIFRSRLDVKVFDTLDILARAVLEQYYLVE